MPKITHGLTAPLFRPLMIPLTADAILRLGGSSPPAWVPTADAVAATLYADFLSEEGSNRYYSNRAQRSNFAAWLSDVGGTFTRASIAYRTNANGLLEQVASGAIRFDHDTSGNPIGILIEGARANIGLQSNSFVTGPWAVINQNSASLPVLTPGAGISPTGDVNATRAVFAVSGSGSGDRSYLRQVITGVALTTYTASIWLKSNDGGNHTVSFLANLAVGTAVTLQAAVTPVWKRFSFTFTTGAAETNIPIWLGCYGNVDQNADVLAFGFQCEGGTFPSSYIPTTTVAASRAADFLSLPWADQTATLLVRTRDIPDGARTQARLIGATANSLSVAPLYITGGFALGTLQAGGGIAKVLTTDWTGERATGVAGDASSRGITGDGFTVASDASGLFGGTPTAIYLGTAASAVNPIFGHISEFSAWAGFKASNTTLQELTAPRWLPNVDYKKANVFADFANGRYWAASGLRNDATAWLSALGGSFTRASTAYRTNASGLLESVANNVLRFNYDPITLAPLGVLIEGARTNSILRSSELANAYWNLKSNITVGAASAVAPDGTTTMESVIPNAGSLTNAFGITTLTVANATAYTRSWYVRNGTLGNNWLQLCVVSGGTYRMWFNLATGVKGSSTGSPTAYGIDNLGGGLFRVWYTITTGSTSWAEYNQLVSADSSLGAITGDGTSPAVHVWGAQVEAGPMASSYIPTTTAAASRAADALNVPWTALTGALYARTSRVRGGSGSRILGLTNTAIGAGLYNLSDASIVTTNGAVGMARTIAPATYAESNKFAVTGNAAGRSITVNGLSVTSDANAFFTGTTSQIGLGNTPGGNAAIFGSMSEFGAWDGARASDTALRTLTAIDPVGWSVPLVGDVKADLYADFANGRFWNYGTRANVTDWIASATGGAFTRSSSAYRTNASGVMELVASGVLRFDYDPITLAPLGILMEVASTNTLPRSQEFDNAAWSKTNVTVTANATAAPDGTMTADKVVEAVTGSAPHLLAQNTTVSAGLGQGFTLSVYAKAAERSWLLVRANTGGSGRVYFNLATGVIGTIAADVTATMTPVGSGWYRCEVRGLAIAAGVVNASMLVTTSDGVETTVGDGASGLYLWGAQCAIGTQYMTSYVPTTTGAATRAADTFVMGAAMTAPWTGYVNHEVPAGQTNGVAMINISADATQFARAIVNGSILSVNNVYQSAHQASFTPAVVPGTFVKFAHRAKDDDFNIVVNGALSTPDTSGFASNTATMGIGQSSGSGQLGGHVKEVGVFPIGAIDTKLQRLAAAPSWVPKADTQPASIFADFTSEGAGNRYWARGEFAGYAKWFSALGGTFTRGSTAYRTNASGLLESVAANAMRFDYDPVTLRPLGILIEGARTNLFPRSQEFDNASSVGWDVSSVTTVVANDIAAPDGTMTADKIDETTANNNHFIRYNGSLTVANASVYTISVYARADERSILAVSETGGGSKSYFNLATGALGSVGAGHTARIEALANGWYRCSVTFTTAGTTITPYFYIQTADPQATYVGVAGNGLHLWGAQIELGAYTSSYIPTAGTSATRAADAMTFPQVLTAPYTLFAKARSTAPTMVAGGYLIEAYTDASNRSALLRSGGAAYAFASSGGVTQANLVGASNIWNTANTIAAVAARFATNNVQNGANGALGAGDTSAAIPAATTIGIGKFITGSNPWDGHIQQIGILPYAASDAALQSLSTP